MQETLKELPKQPYAWATEEFNIHGELVWSSITQFRPKELSWIRDLPTKKHYITITPLFMCFFAISAKENASIIS